MKIVVWTGVVAIGLALVAGALSGHPVTQPTSAAGNVTSSAPQVTEPVKASTSSPTATTSTPPPPAPAPALAIAMTCAPGGASASFAHDITAPAPYSIDISYGDGDTYRNTDQHLNAVFTHTYKTPGTYTVRAVLREPDGRTVTTGCTYDFAAAAVAPHKASKTTASRSTKTSSHP